MERLHDFAGLLSTAEPHVVLDQALVAAMQIQAADFGHVQINDRQAGGLVIVAQRNFQPEFLDNFALVRLDDGCACGRAFRTQARVIIEDVETDESFAPHRRCAAEAGFRAVQSTPLLGHRGEVLGVLSTHFREPHRPADAELRATDLYVRLVSQMLERMRAEEDCGRLASIVQHSRDFIGILSLAGKPLFLNAAGRRLIGLEEDEPIPESLHNYFVGEESELRVTALIRRSLERKGFWEGERSLRHVRTGSVVPVLQHVFHICEPLCTAPVAIAVVCRDITARRTAEEAAGSAQRELAHAARLLSMGELATSIAHEINQPLAAIVANGNACRRWLEREPPELREARASLDHIVRDAYRASDVIRRVRKFSTKETPARALLDLNDVIREVLAFTQDETRREEVEVQTRLLEPLAPVVGDRVELQQVVLNLVMNSIEALRAVFDRPRCLSIVSTHAQSDLLQVCVRDNGIGVSPDDLRRLFAPFYTTKATGMGLGLAISRRIIEAHGGQLTATPGPVNGLILSFRLPASLPS
jgi:PAS domain S-box-containing protein